MASSLKLDSIFSTKTSSKPPLGSDVKQLKPVISTVTVEAVEHNDHWTAATLSEEDLELIYSHLEDRPFEEWLQILRDAVEYHRDDPLLGPGKHEFLERISKGPLPDQSKEEWEGLVSFEAFVIHEWSIYPEVRNATVPIDEPDTGDYANVRVFVISSIWTLAGATIDTFFATRSPAISISSMALQILIALSGHLWARLPRITVPVGFGKRIELNSGLPWSFKEQMLATLGMTVAAGSPYSQNTIITQGNSFFYNMPAAQSFGYQITLTLSTAFMGFGFGGLFRSILVYPSKMPWFVMLSTLPISRTFAQKDHRENINGWKLKRGEFVGIVSLIVFCWYWIVTNVLSFLSNFDWICYIAPNNVDANAMTGLWTGVGLNPFPSFDFSIIGNFTGILTPVYAYSNYMIGILISTIATIIVWYTNVRHTGYFPIFSPLLYDNTGNSFDVSKILNPKTLLFDMERYQEYSLPYWSAGNVVSYGSFFLIYPLGFVHAILNNYKDLKMGFFTMFQGLNFWKGKGNRAIDRFNDSFSRRQARSREVPEWVYFLILLASFGMAIGCVEGYGFTDTPVWTIVLGLGLAFVFVPVFGIMYATAGYQIEDNVLFELIIGLAYEGHNQTLLVSKCFATNFFSQADNWISNQKLAHYSGISPWSFFTIQCWTTCICSFVQVGIMTFQLNGGIRDMCDPKNKDFFRCNGVRTYFNASVIWGLIGPRRVFKGLYPQMKWCFLIGAVIPIPFFIWRKFGPSLAKRMRLAPKSPMHGLISGSFLRYVNELVIATGLISPGFGSQGLGYTVFSDYYIHLLFQLYVRRKFPRWWTKYAYLLVSSLSIGTGWAAFFNFWATEYHNLVYLNAWTNNVVTDNMDYNYTAVRKVVPDGEIFGPPLGSLPR